ncbi:MAG: thiopurine S-methyltransferase [Deltaproteobacteria bacterium]|nr:thiopurine S-methyltransferase [Deltaproteobacteria bacterium]
MEHAFWQSRWSEGRIGFHRAEPSADLVTHAPASWSPDARVLVPLAGKSVDLAWLAGRFREVVGVEFVRAAAVAFFAERGIVPEVRDESGVEVLAHHNLSLRVQDFLELDPERVGHFDAAWDRAAIVALPEPTRARYAERLVALMRPGARILLASFEYPQAAMAGPPFSVGDEELLALFSPATTPVRLDRRVVDDRRPPSLSDDTPIHTSIWSFTRNPR